MINNGACSLVNDNFTFPVRGVSVSRVCNFAQVAEATAGDWYSVLGETETL